ncbi:Sad1-interacting factor 3 [Blastocladiella emersonii ATCC 22665]|nr:Sad1-interacting factor 3 [Blastocladiella emersonii ATCC 22665]
MTSNPPPNYGAASSSGSGAPLLPTSAAPLSSPSAGPEKKPAAAIGSAVRFRIITPPTPAGRSPATSPVLPPVRGGPSGSYSAPVSPLAPTAASRDFPFAPSIGPRVPLRTTSSKLAHPTPKTVLLPDGESSAPPSAPTVAAPIPVHATPPTLQRLPSTSTNNSLLLHESTPLPPPAIATAHLERAASPTTGDAANVALPASLGSSPTSSMLPPPSPTAVRPDDASDMTARRALDALLVQEIAQDVQHPADVVVGPTLGFSTTPPEHDHDYVGGPLPHALPVHPSEIHAHLVHATPEGMLDDSAPVTVPVSPVPSPRPPSQQHIEHIQEISSSAGARTMAEHIAKEDRTWLPRCTAYVTSPSFRFADLITFLVVRHKVQVRAYDECLYATYPQFCHQPLYATPAPAPEASNLPGAGDPYGGGGLPGQFNPMQSQQQQPSANASMADLRRTKSLSQSHLLDGSAPSVAPLPRPVFPGSSIEHGFDMTGASASGVAAASAAAAAAAANPSRAAVAHPILPAAECCIFNYGVVVCWGMTEKEEQWLLREIRQFGEVDGGGSSSTGGSDGGGGTSLFEDDFDDENLLESLHYQYDPSATGRPRIYNDIITLRDGHHMTKVTISHGIAQSCKLLLFEIRMEAALENTRHIPKSLAQTGNVQLSPREITTLTGQLYRLRMDLNLVSNVLDVPDMFWTMPGWQPLYRAVQKYLEIEQRSKTLNLRASVLSDLLDMLSSHVTSTQMDWMTYVVIILIAIDVLVLSGEIVMKAIKIGG